MSDLFSLNALDIWYLKVLVVDLLIAVGIIASLRFVSGLVANVNTTEELSQRDNHAFGLSLAAGAVALSIMLTGVVSGDEGSSLVNEALLMLSYGVVGLVLIKIGRLIQDRLILPAVAIQQQIRQGNMATAFVDAANTLTIGLVLRAVMIWVESSSFVGLSIVLAAFLITQILLAVVTRYRLLVYARRHNGASLENAFEQGNTALSIRYFGHLLGTGLAVTAASNVVSYNDESPLIAIAAWVVFILLFALLVSLLAIVARKIILTGIDVVEEVDRQKNIGIGAIEAAIYIAIGLFIAALFA